MGPTTILILGGILALVLLVIGLIITATEERSLVDERLEYLEEEGVPVVGKKQILGEWVGKQAVKYSWGQSLTRSLARADIKMKVGEFILLTMILTALGGLLGWFLAGGASSVGEGGTSKLATLPGVFIGGLVGFFVPTIYMKRQQGRRLIKFDNQLADMLSLRTLSSDAAFPLPEGFTPFADT